MTNCPNSPLEHSPEQVYANAMAAIDWLEANPDKHTTDMYARTADKGWCRPQSPEAVCFCTLGRIIKEAELPTLLITGYLKIIGVADDDVAEMNDARDPLSKIRSHITRRYKKVATEGRN